MFKLGWIGGTGGGDSGTRLIGYVVMGLLVGGFLWYHIRKQRKLDRLRRQQRDRENSFKERRAEEELESWAAGEDEQPACGICRGTLGDDRIDCPGCGTGFHQHCWELNDGCNRCGYRVSIMG